MSQAIVIRGRLADRVRREAERLGLSVDEYLVELLTQDLDPPGRAREYIEAARGLLEQAREELERGDARQAAEKLWGAAALAVKAYAYWREGRRLSSHRELWEYMRAMTKDIGPWVREAWMYATSMHVCFYEGWCTEEDVRDALEKIRRLVEEVAERMKQGRG